jgi:hypothetical protein
LDLACSSGTGDRRRRISGTQRKLLKGFGVDTPAEEEVRKWNTFWDAPLVIPGGGDTTDLPRTADEIQRGFVSYDTRTCRVSSDGARVSVVFDGLTLGLFPAISSSRRIKDRTCCARK